LHLLIDEAKRVDLMLTDVVMPGMNGRELARRAQALRPNLPVLFMTGYSRNAVMHQGRLDEGVEFIQKPISQGQLAARVREILDRAPKASRNS
jgi:CheY-like chemotaxis protein